MIRQAVFRPMMGYERSSGERRLSLCLSANFPVQEWVYMPAPRTVPGTFDGIGIPSMNHLYNEMAV